MYSSANFDEDVFADPMNFDIARNPNPHMAFGHGIHLCLGANLARMEARIFFEEFFRHFAHIESCAEPVFIRSNLIHGFKADARVAYACLVRAYLQIMIAVWEPPLSRDKPVRSKREIIRSAGLSRDRGSVQALIKQ